MGRVGGWVGGWRSRAGRSEAASAGKGGSHQLAPAGCPSSSTCTASALLSAALPSVHKSARLHRASTWCAEQVNLLLHACRLSLPATRSHACAPYLHGGDALRPCHTPPAEGPGNGPQHRGGGGGRGGTGAPPGKACRRPALHAWCLCCVCLLRCTVGARLLRARTMDLGPAAGCVLPGCSCSLPDLACLWTHAQAALSPNARPPPSPLHTHHHRHLLPCRPKRSMRSSWRRRQTCQ